MLSSNRETLTPQKTLCGIMSFACTRMPDLHGVGEPRSAVKGHGCLVVHMVPGCSFGEVATLPLLHAGQKESY